MVPYGVTLVALPIVTYLAQPSQCFWYLYAPITVPVLGSLVLACAGVQHLSAMHPRAKLACAIVFGVGIQFTTIVPCFSGIDDSPEALQLALWSLLFGAAAAVAMLVVAASMFFPRAASQALPMAIAGIGQSVSAVAVLWGVGFVYPVSYTHLTLPTKRIV